MKNNNGDENDAPKGFKWQQSPPCITIIQWLMITTIIFAAYFKICVSITNQINNKMIELFKEVLQGTDTRSIADHMLERS